MPKIRILVVDDAVVFRRVLSDVLSSDPDLEVVGTAANGRIALAKLPQLTPDIVILDVEMPEMDGLQTLKELRKSYPRLPVIMFSALTEKGAEATLEALARGATDYFTKPASVSGVDASIGVIRDELIPEIKALCAPKAPAPAAHPSSSGSRPAVAPAASAKIVAVVAIGVSTGGPNALAEVFAGLPADFPVPIVIAQHMPAMFTRMLADRLSALSSIRVEEGAAGTILEPGRAWVAPGERHMVVVRDESGVRLMLNQDPPENSCRPSVDVLFRSAARFYGAGTLGVVLTGMGQDGLRGSELIHEAGGQIIAQDESTSVVWGMPGFVVRAGLADKVLPLSEMAGEITRRVWMGRRPSGSRCLP
jgi:two-component system chemotaxis response regulator CheB